MLVHAGPHVVDFGEQGVLEAPQDLVDGAVHEDVHAQGGDVDGDHAPQEEGVGVQLVHHRLQTEDTPLEWRKGRGEEELLVPPAGPNECLRK